MIDPSVDAGSSGEAARWMAIAGVAVAGQNIVAPSTLSEDVYTFFKYRLSPYNISVKFVDIDDPDAIRAAIDENTRTVYIESISSVGLAVADIESISSIAHAAGIPLIV
jgi:O-acetylhomoserine/O-acetylserine sulfhydrylase